MTNQKIAICPGSFDPATKGHVDIIQRASKLFDKIIVLVLVNPNKKPSFDEKERVALLKKAVGHIENVEIDSYHGLLADYARDKQAKALVKGLRAMSDFEYEFQQSLTNKILNPDLETLFVNTSSEFMYLSSSMVKQVASLGGDISHFVVESTLEDIQNRLCKGE